MHLPSGTLLQGGKYRIERVLGQGGFGITYLATQVMLDRQVAIKEFFMRDYCSRESPTHSMTLPMTDGRKLVEQYRTKFVKEAHALASLNHSSIISIIEIFEENDTVYYAMPYMTNGSLQEKVKRDGPIDEASSLRYIQQVAAALQYMHQTKHMCHYDVKPANILIDDNGTALLIDFGISKHYDQQGHETTGTPVGLSEGYAPIEQYSGDLPDFSPESDVYALGATLCFLLTSKIPPSSIARAGGTQLNLPSNVSSSTRRMIYSAMTVSRRERPNDMALFQIDGDSFIKHLIGWSIWVLVLVAAVFGLYLGAKNYFKKELPMEQLQKNDTIVADTNILNPTTDDTIANLEQIKLRFKNRVRDIYDDVESQEIIDLETLYCSKEWNELWASYMEKEGKSQYLGPVDYDYWVMGHDSYNFHATDIQVLKIENETSGLRAIVSLNLHNSGDVIPITIELVEENNELKIDNFITKNSNLKREIKLYLKS